MLKISPANAKTRALYKQNKLRAYLHNRQVYSLDLSAGHSCPFAYVCKSKVVKKDKGLRIVDGPHCQVRCFAASAEVLYSNTYLMRKHNFELIKAARTVNVISKLILESLPSNCGVLRYHVSGDFFSAAYFMAAIKVAELRPDIAFYAYTKNIPALIKYQGMIPANLSMVASYGGTHDHLIQSWRGATATITHSTYEAKKRKLPVDHTDSHAFSGKPFAILIHGTQPATTKAAVSLMRMRKKGINGYAR